MGVREDILFLEHQAQMSEADRNEGDAKWLRDIAGRLRNPPIETVEQGVLFTKSPSVPDGWSWTDVPALTGKYSGIRLKKGNNPIEQVGHVIWLMQAETSLDEKGRYEPIFEQQVSSRVWVPDVTGDWEFYGERGSFELYLSIILVFGFNGERKGIIRFLEGGKQGPLETIESGQEIHDAIKAGLDYAWTKPRARDFRQTVRKTGPRQGKLKES